MTSTAPSDALTSLPLVYSCSGCSSAAQLANHLALRLAREGLAEMSCIAGVGGRVKSMVKTARSGRPILALDGCALNCVESCLASVGVEAVTHVRLSDHGVRRVKFHDYSQEDVDRLWPLVQAEAEMLAEG